MDSDSSSRGGRRGSRGGGTLGDLRRHEEREVGLSELLGWNWRGIAGDKRTTTRAITRGVMRLAGLMGVKGKGSRTGHANGHVGRSSSGLLLLLGFSEPGLEGEDKGHPGSRC